MMGDLGNAIADSVIVLVVCALVLGAALGVGITTCHNHYSIKVQVEKKN